MTGMNLRDYVDFLLLDADIPDWAHWIAIDPDDGFLILFEFKPRFESMTYDLVPTKGYWTTRKLKHHMTQMNFFVPLEFINDLLMSDLVFER
jgi:hypothetical protein